MRKVGRLRIEAFRSFAARHARRTMAARAMGRESGRSDQSAGRTCVAACTAGDGACPPEEKSPTSPFLGQTPEMPRNMTLASASSGF
jgi:hypothetical protein